MRKLFIESIKCVFLRSIKPQLRVRKSMIYYQFMVASAVDDSYFRVKNVQFVPTQPTLLTAGDMGEDVLMPDEKFEMLCYLLGK